MKSRRALAGLVTILPLAVLLLVVTALPPPDRVPTHWDGNTPDGWTGGAEFLSGVLTVTVLCALVAAASAILQRAIPQAWSRWAVAVASAVGWGGVLLYVVTVWRTEADGPESVGTSWPLLAVVGGLVAGAIGYVVHGRQVPPLRELRDQVPERSRTQVLRGRAVQPVEPWSTDVESRTMKVIGWVLLAAFAVTTALTLVSGESPALVTVVVLVGLGASGLALAWSSVRLQVDSDGVQVRSRVLPVTVTRVRAEDVVGVEVLVLDPMRWGGVGLRALPERTAYIVDGGPGLVVWKRDGRRLALQVTEGDAVARAGARTLLQAAGQRWGERPPAT